MNTAAQNFIISSGNLHHSQDVKTWHVVKVTKFVYDARDWTSERKMSLKYYEKKGFPGGSVVKNLPANAGDMGLIPDPGRSHMLQGN